MNEDQLIQFGTTFFHGFIPFGLIFTASVAVSTLASRLAGADEPFSKVDAAIFGTVFYVGFSAITTDATYAAFGNGPGQVVLDVFAGVFCAAVFASAVSITTRFRRGL